jgi:DNA replication protein DnaC
METRLNNRLSTAHLKGCPEDIAMCVNSAAREYKPDGIAETLGTLDFIDKGQNVCILGPSDIGKSYLAKALGILACSRFSVEYHHCEPLVESLAAMKAKAYDKYQKKIRQLTKRDLLIIDDFLLHSITDEREIKVLFEVLEKRSELSKSTIVCSQREPKSWKSMILNDEVSSNAIMKRATKHYTVVIKPS